MFAAEECIENTQTGSNNFSRKTYYSIVLKYWRVLMIHSFPHHRGATALVAIFFLAFTTAVYAQKTPGPQPAPPSSPIAAPADTPFHGTISLVVDVTNTADRVLDVHKTIPI